MKTAISVPDPVFKRADRLAKKLRISRSQLYSQAVSEFLARHQDAAVYASYAAVCKEVDTRPDPALQEAVRRVLDRVEW